MADPGNNLSRILQRFFGKIQRYSWITIRNQGRI